jgi:hypothetical protein
MGRERSAMKYHALHPDAKYTRCWNASFTTQTILDNIIKDSETGCWNWQRGRHERGYGLFRENKKQIRVHRKSYELFKGPIPEGMMVCHHCDNPPCCNPDHLFVGTCTDNLRDCSSKGRKAAVNRSLSNEQATAIKSDPRRNREIAKDYGILDQTVYAIKKGLYYRYDAPPK